MRKSASRGPRGFTILELMMVVAIIGILASIAITKFNSTLRKSKEGQAKGNLGAIRSAVHAYYADTVTTHPPNLEALTTDGKYLTAIPFKSARHYRITTNNGSEIDIVAARVLLALPAP